MSRHTLPIVLFLLAGFLSVELHAQDVGETVGELESRREGLQRQIAETESLLSRAKSDTRSQLNSLTTLSSQIEERRRYISLLEGEVARLEQEIGALNRQLEQLQRDLAEKRDQYAASVRHMRRNSSVEDKLLFVFSADNLAKIYRRARYVREYATFRRLQGEEILKKQAEVEKKQDELTKAKTEKEQLLREREAERDKLMEREKEKRRLVDGLKKKQQSLQSTIAQKRREADRLNSRIDRLIAEELERQRRAAAAAVTETETGATVETGSAPLNAEKKDLALSGSFASNRGRLPIPITGAYLITGHYGQYEVEGLKNVKLDSKGIDIQGHPGAQARAVFDGRVAAVFKLNGLFNVLVRHGQYISVYCNLSSATVKMGDEVKTRQSLGPIFSDKNDGGRTVLHFQLRKEKEKLNPEAWLAK